MKKALMKSVTKKSLAVLLLFAILLSLAGCEIRKRQRIVDQPMHLWAYCELYRVHFFTEHSVLEAGEDLTVKLVFYPDIQLTPELEAEGWRDPLPKSFSVKMRASYDIIDEHHNVAQKSTVLDLLTLDTIGEEMYEEYELEGSAVRAIVREITIPASCFEGTYGSILIGTYFDFTVTSSAVTEVSDSNPEIKTAKRSEGFYYRRDRSRIILFDNSADYYAYPYEPEDRKGNVHY